MTKIYFIVLNYNTADETKKCVYSIRQLGGMSYIKHIIIIDNASTDDSMVNLREYFSGDEDVELYRMDDNVGFSRGNNCGYQIVRKTGDADFCIVCNSDIEFVQDDFLKRVEEEYKKSGFYICGPDVYCNLMKNSYGKGHQSPMYPFEWNKRYLDVYRSHYELLYQKLSDGVFFKKGTIRTQIRWLGWKIIKKFSTEICYRNYRKVRHENIPVHGSCIIVSRDFVEKEEVLFYPEIKFYGEELLLYLRCKRNHYKIVFNPELMVNHLQGRATSSIKSSKQMQLFRYGNYANAAQTYLENLKNENNK